MTAVETSPARNQTAPAQNLCPGRHHAGGGPIPSGVTTAYSGRVMAVTS